MKDYCHCTGRQSKWCHCNYVVKEHHALKARVKAAKAIAWVAFGGLLVVATLGLTGCALKPEAHPYPHGQFQGSVEQWDEQLFDQCTDLAIDLVGQVYKQLPDPKPSDNDVKQALNDTFNECMAQNGRQI